MSEKFVSSANCSEPRTVRFIDDRDVQENINAVSRLAVEQLAGYFPEMPPPRQQELTRTLAKVLASALTTHAPETPPLVLGRDAFGDPFAIDELPLPRTGTGYAVQKLDTDTLLDKLSGSFRPVRDPQLSGLFDSFNSAYGAAKEWLRKHPTLAHSHPVAIVPAYFDESLHRHVLIYGVLTQSP